MGSSNRFTISFILAIAPLICTYMGIRGALWDYALWAHGEDGVVQPIYDYKETVDEKKDAKGVQRKYYNADLKVKLPDGATVRIDNKPLGLQQIKDSRHGRLKIRVVPDDPQTNRFDGVRSFTILMFFLAGLASVLAYHWFRWLRNR